VVACHVIPSLALIVAWMLLVWGICTHGWSRTIPSVG
jgi:hypothetical protein